VRRPALAVVDPIQSLQPRPQTAHGGGCRRGRSCGRCAGGPRSGLRGGRADRSGGREHSAHRASGRRLSRRDRCRVLWHTGQGGGQR
jgi:hypothetical protein